MKKGKEGSFLTPLATAIKKGAITFVRNHANRLKVFNKLGKQLLN